MSITADVLQITSQRRPSENTLFSVLKSDYLCLFSTLFHRSTYNRKRRKLQPYIAAISQCIVKRISTDPITFILDSIPLLWCQNVRVHKNKIGKKIPIYHTRTAIMLPINAPILSGTPLRYKLQDLLTQNDVPFAVEINSTHVHDVNFLKQLELLQIYDCQIVADKGYLSIKQHEELLLKHNISIITPWRANMKFMEQ